MKDSTQRMKDFLETKILAGAKAIGIEQDTLSSRIKVAAFGALSGCAVAFLTASLVAACASTPKDIQSAPSTPICNKP